MVYLLECSTGNVVSRIRIALEIQIHTHTHLTLYFNAIEVAYSKRPIRMVLYKSGTRVLRQPLRLMSATTASSLSSKARILVRFLLLLLRCSENMIMFNVQWSFAIWHAFSPAKRRLHDRIFSRQASLYGMFMRLFAKTITFRYTKAYVLVRMYLKWPLQYLRTSFRITERENMKIYKL